MKKLQTLFRFKDLQERYGVSRTTIYKWMGLGIFPNSDKKIGGTPYWFENTLLTFEKKGINQSKKLEGSE